MTTKSVLMADLHFEHRLWTNQLNFYKEEVGMFEQYLGEASLKYSDQDSRSGIERFQNQFIRQKEVIDVLIHDIKIHEQSLSGYAQEHPVEAGKNLFEDHGGLRDRMETFEKIYRELKDDFRQFLARHM